jgi:hypothetical protein
MRTLYAEGELGRYLRNALRSAASAELLKPVADAVAIVLGTTAAGGTQDELERAIDTFPSGGTCAEPFERNARFAAAEFALDQAELDILLLALRARRGRQLARSASSRGSAAPFRPSWASRLASSRRCLVWISTRCGSVWRPARVCAAAV